MPIVKGFRRFQSNIVCFRQVVSEISSVSVVVPGSNGQQSGCGAAPFTSKSKSKRISIADRRELLESFVNKYRGMNSGKFPSPTSAQKEVGGGYYSIRKLLQEMEYNYKLSSLEKLSVTKETKKQNKSEDTVIASPSQQVSNSQITMDQNLYEDAWLECVGNLDKNSKGLQPSTSKNITRDDDTHSIATQSQERRRAECDEQLENDGKDKSPLENAKFGFEGVDSKVEQQHEHEHEHVHDGNVIRNIARETSETKKKEELREKASSSSSSSSISIWGNLKSLASGFINIWKKQ
ncbi:unnamed protein product [Lactuca virosa]|uniref:AT3G52170-like helix-turn-helix domain-containing protein n=1 Tax=Lactuca virosa TaxID=75947 RepID=A0AAU9M2X5_9ASTR|nr:unnamed protein product [Lactuca virosa]